MLQPTTATTVNTGGGGGASSTGSLVACLERAKSKCDVAVISGIVLAFVFVLVCFDLFRNILLCAS